MDSALAAANKRDDDQEFRRFQEEKAEMSRKKDEMLKMKEVCCLAPPNDASLKQGLMPYALFWGAADCHCP